LIPHGRESFLRGLADHAMGHYEDAILMNCSTLRYGTEEPVGRAIQKAIREYGVSRDQLFVTTKIWNNKHHPDDVERALQDSLNDLRLDYVDLYLMHYPVAWKRGDDMFPQVNGKPAMEAIDYVEVNMNLTFLSRGSVNRLPF
jgi:alcohol dehydrogenase (NADP+)